MRAFPSCRDSICSKMLGNAALLYLFLCSRHLFAAPVVYAPKRRSVRAFNVFHLKPFNRDTFGILSAGAIPYVNQMKKGTPWLILTLSLVPCYCGDGRRQFDFGPSASA